MRRKLRLNLEENEYYQQRFQFETRDCRRISLKFVYKLTAFSPQQDLETNLKNEHFLMFDAFTWKLSIEDVLQRIQQVVTAKREIKSSRNSSGCTL